MWGNCNVRGQDGVIVFILVIIGLDNNSSWHALRFHPYAESKTILSFQLYCSSSVINFNLCKINTNKVCLIFNLLIHDKITRFFDRIIVILCTNFSLDYSASFGFKLKSKVANKKLLNSTYSA